MKVLTDNKADVKEVANGKVIVSKIYPESNISIILWWQSDRGVPPSIVPLNHLEQSFTYTNARDIRRGEIVNWWDILIQSMIIAIAFGFSTHYFNRLRQSLYDRIAEQKLEIANTKKEWQERRDENDKILRERLEETQNQADEASVQLKRPKESVIKFKLLFVRKSRDLEKENRFYKELLKIITQKSIDIDSKDLEKAVTKKLKTYSVNAEIETGVDTLDVMAGMLNDSNDLQSK